LVGKLWPTPNAREKGGGEYQDPEKIKARMDKGHQTNLGDAVKLWPTPRVSMANGPSAMEVEAGDPKRRLETSVQVAQASLYPTPVTPSGGGERSGDRAGTGNLDYMARSGQLAGPKTTGSLNPRWVAWLMGYPTEDVNSVPWETASSRRSRKKSDKQ